MKRGQQDFRTEKYIRYGIRKYSFGAASVAIAAGLMFLGAGAVSATEVQGAEASVAATSPAGKTDQDTAEAKPETTKAAEVKPETKAEEAPKEVVAPKLDKTQLESYVNQVAGNIAAGKYANKTDESLALLNADLEAAKAALSSANSQDELKAAYNKLVTTVNSKLQNKPVEKKAAPAVDTTNGKETVGKKAENTEKKSESNAIENTGSKDERNGKELVQGSHLRSANEGYTLASTELRKTNGEFATATGKSYKVLDNNADYKIYVRGYQSENTEVAAANNGKAATSGRTDIPLSKTEAQKISEEAARWTRKPRVTGNNNGSTVYGSKGAYEYLTTEIYGYTYQQGNHYVYIKDAKNRFSLSPEAQAAGYTITKVDLSNLPPGLAYNSTTDTVEGYIASDLQNGVYDMRYEVTVSHNGATQKVTFKDLTAGWIGWQDSSAPLIQGTSKLVTKGDQVNHNIKYIDNDVMSRDERAGYVYSDSRRPENGQKVVAGSATASTKTIGATFTAVDGTTVKTMNGPRTITAHTALNGDYTGSQTSINDVVPGLNYNPQNGNITGTATEAGIFTATAYAKDYNNTTNATNQDWNMYGQEAHENITIAVAPKITVKNVEAYATNVPVTISKGANKAEITMPDGTVTKLVVKDGNWTVAAGTTNTAVQEGAVLGAASTTGESTLNLTVTPESTKYVGVDSIVAKATTDRVQANLQREVYTVKGVNNKEYTATFNSATGKYNLPTEDAYQLVNNGDGTSTLTERRVYTDAKANGDTDYIVYEFTRKWSATSDATNLVDKIAEIREKGQVTEVKDVTRTITSVPKVQVPNTQGNIVTVNYYSVTKRWTASDGSTVTATESNAGWKLETDSGFKGYVSYREASSTDVASIQNAKPTGTSTSYSEAKGTTVDLIKSTKANVAFADTIDDKTSATDSDTIKTKVTATAPDGTVTTFDGAQTEETAYIQAQRTAAEKTKAAATAVKEQQDTQNELANLQELLDRQSRIEADAQKALDNLKLRSISPTAQELAERKLKHVKEFKASVEKQLATAQANLLTKNTEVESTRAAALEAEKAVETARAALKTAAEANLAKANAYVLSQKGRYKVTARAVDSNGVVTTPTVDETNAGEVTEDAVAETTYYIVVTESEKSSGAQGQKQTDSMVDNFNDGKEGTTVSDYKLVDPITGNKVSSVTTDQGTYTVDSTTGEVTFTPAEGFVGTAAPMKVSATVTFNDESGSQVRVATENTYTPTVYGVQPSKDETTGKQGQTQTSKSGKDRFSELNTTANTPDRTNVDWATAAYSLEGANEKGEVEVEGEGTYSIDSTTGVVTFKPLPTFKGEGKGVNVQVSVMATDSEGNQVPVTSKGKYTPTVTGVTPTAKEATSTGIQGETQKGIPTFTAGDVEVPIKDNSAVLLDKQGNPVAAGTAVNAEDANGNKVGEYTIDPTSNTVTFTPTDKAYVGKVLPANVQAEDVNGTTVKTTYTPIIVGVKPTATPAESTNIQGEVQTGVVAFAPGKATISGVEKTVAIKAGSAKLVNADGSVPTEATVPAYKEDGVTQVGTYSIDPATNTVTFTPTDKTYTGKVLPANVQAEDVNGSTVKTTYTPHIVGVAPTADPATSTDVQGVEQSKEVTFVPGKADINGTEKSAAIDPLSYKVLGENGQPADEVEAKDPNGKVVGKFTVKNVDGKAIAVFTPTDKTYVGAVKPVTVQAADTNGTTVTTTYTPTITPIKPTGTPVTTEGIQGAEQSGTPTFTQGSDKVPMKIDADQPAKLVDPETGNPTDKTTIPAKDAKGNTVGTYTIKPTTGEVTFTPNKDFKGTPVPATVEAKDANGTPATAKYTPTVKPATPTGTDAVTEDVQGATQEGTPVFTTGKATVNGTEVEVPFDTKVPAKLVDPATKQPTDEKSVTVPNEGTYTIDENGKVTFTPEKTFTGKTAGIDVRRVDTNGTPVTAKYTPVVRPATPTSSDVVTTNVQGATQEGTPTFTGGKVTINGQEKTVKIDEAVKPKFDDGTTTKTVPNEGTYTIDENGKVTFTPEKTFTGQATGVTVKRVDTNGTPVTAKYTPVVIPVSPTSKDAESEGPKGQSQEGTPTFTGGKVTLNGKEVPVEIDEAVKPKFDDGTTTKKVPNEGTYTIDENGKVTFTPEPNFVGQATGVTVKRVDKNGTPVTAKYIPTVRPDTRYVVIEKDGKETDLLPPKDGTKPSEQIPGYNVVRTEIDEKGNTKHIYEKVTTSFVDESGKPVSPSEEGNQPKKAISGYEFVKTTTDKDGNVTHVYRKVVKTTTSFVDESGKPVSPSEEGSQPKKDIPGYRFVETKKLSNGDTVHVYEKVTPPAPTPSPVPQPNPGKQNTTTWTDEGGNPLKPTEPGSKEPGTIPGYEYVKTVTDSNGNIRHIFRRVEMPTPTPVEPTQPAQPVEPATPAIPEQPAKPQMPATPKYVDGQKELPNTGTEANASLAALGLLGALGGFGLVTRKKKED